MKSLLNNYLDRGGGVKSIMGMLLVFIVLIFSLMCWPKPGIAAMTGLEAHEKYIYPLTRTNGASGTIIYSAETEDGTYSTYILTNYHVIRDAIRIVSKWDSDLQKDIKKEKRSIIYVESFKYRDISTPIGTLKVEADIVLYNETEDLALVKLRSEEQYQYVATLLSKDKVVRVMDETVAVGCSLGWPPLPTTGVITRLNFQLDSLPFHMSSSQIIYGNSGGAMFLAETGELIGIPSRGVVIGWGTPIEHMGFFIGIERITKWLKDENYDFIFDDTKTEKDSLKIREEKIKRLKEDSKK